jgi:hypothetical protein
MIRSNRFITRPRSVAKHGADLIGSGFARAVADRLIGRDIASRTEPSARAIRGQRRRRFLPLPAMVANERSSPPVRCAGQSAGGDRTVTRTLRISVVAKCSRGGRFFQRQEGVEALFESM